jgi:hypothetical protein
MILIIAPATDPPAAKVYQEILRQGGSAVFLDTQRFPGDVSICLSPEHPSQNRLRVPGHDNPVTAAEIQAVYYRWNRGVACHETNPELYQMLSLNAESALGSFLRQLDSFWVNPLEAMDALRYKGDQLQKLSAAGIRVPQTILTNQPDELAEFYHRMEGAVITKAPRGWVHTRRLTDDDLSPERRALLRTCPAIFQEFVEGTDIRVYRIADQLFATEISSATVDFREDEAAQRIPIQLPEDVAQQCHCVAAALGLVYTGIDLRRTPAGEYVFFEANGSPYFLLEEEAVGYPLAATLASLLLSGKP